jgi:hypothetical protein
MGAQFLCATPGHGVCRTAAKHRSGVAPAYLEPLNAPAEHGGAGKVLRGEEAALRLLQRTLHRHHLQGPGTRHPTVMMRVMVMMMM